MFYQVMVHVHSVLRWVVLLTIVIVIFRSLILLITREKESRAGKRLPAVTLSLLHIQVLIGFILYFISPKVVFAASSMKYTLLRFFLVEHSALMILAAILATIGVVISNKVMFQQKKHTRLFLFFLMALIVIYIAIPWPWKPLSAGWF